MDFNKPEAEIVLISQDATEQNLNKTTDLCIAAHQDDIEIMAYGAISACLNDAQREFVGAVVSNGGGSPRGGIYANYSDSQMKAVRKEEQKNAARIGGYFAQTFLEFESNEIKDPQNSAVAQDIEKLLLICKPTTVYTHNLADKHDTHVSVALRVIEALRRLPEESRPKKIYSMEVWRGLDWLCDEDKTLFDTSRQPDIAAELIGVFESQIADGKRYDLAAIGRRMANATFFDSHSVDVSDSISFGLDITALAYDENLSPETFIRKYIERFEKDVSERILRLI